MMAKQQTQIYEARMAKQSNQLIGEMMATLTGIKKVYNMILEVESNGYAMSDEMIEKLWPPSSDKG